MQKKEWRIYFLLACLFLIYGTIVSRLFYVQVLKHGVYTAQAQDQSEIIKKIIPLRGEIFVQDKNSVTTPLAILREYPLVFLVPGEIQDKEKTAETLAGILGMDQQTILDKEAATGSLYVPLKSKLEDSVAAQVQGLNLKGVYVSSENLRWYPQNELAAHVLGFVGYSGDKRLGQYGLEGYYEKELAGVEGALETQKDALGNSILTDSSVLTPASDGDSLYLTIDPNIQFMAEQDLKAVLDKWQSPAGSVIVMDPKTGAIRAMANFPNFNPNEYSSVDNIDVYMDSAIQETYEPGSIFKPITMAAGLDTGSVSPNTTYVDSGSVTVGGWTITNAVHRSYGLSDMSRILEESINTGAVFVEQKLGNDNFKKYVQAFGIDKPTGVDLAGEAAGNISNLRPNHDLDSATAAFGQGITVTPLEIANAIGAIANNGKLMKPYVVDKIVHADGQSEQIQPQMIRQVVTPKTAQEVTAMLVNTVRKGYDKIKMNDYLIAGKTGTAQIAVEGKPGYGEETIHSFVGYAPAYDPFFLVFIKMDKPKGINFASDSLTTVFASMAKYLFNYYQIAPDAGNSN